jgi:two-component system, OmpR family, phosphate regulon sensor histidine kinase PhoR
MQKKLFISYIAIAILALGIATLAFWSKGYSYLDNQGYKYHLMQAQLLTDVFEEAELETQGEYDFFANKFAKQYGVRITIIDQEGEVITDSGSSEELENHATREEIVKALKGESASVVRYSKTMKQYLAYSAIPINTEKFKGVLRVSLPSSEIRELGNELIVSVLFSVSICLLIAILVAILFTRIITNPINDVTQAAEKICKGDYGIKIYTRDKTQIGRLATAFNTMAMNLNTSMAKLTTRNVELEAMLSSMSSGVVAIDNNKNIIFHNDEFANMIHAKSKNMSNNPIYQEVQNALIFKVIDSVNDMGGDIMNEGYLNIADTADNKVIRIIGTPLVGEENKSLGVLLIIEDISQIKKLENMRSDFVSNVTHELKTPLTSIRGFIDTLKAGGIRDEKVARKFLDIIDIESERLYTLIQDILLLSEIESKKDYELVELDVRNCIQDVIELLEPKLSEEVEIVYHPEPYIKYYNCNPDRIKELIINLLDNAMKYTEKGTIKVECLEEEKELVIRVTDTGIGMEEEHLSRIFERFYRVDRGRSRKQGGTGLGLSIVKHIVELYDGRIKVDSQPNKGTTFEIRLPY